MTVGDAVLHLNAMAERAERHASLVPPDSSSAILLREYARDAKALRVVVQALEKAGEDGARLDWCERRMQSGHVFDPPSGDAWVWTVEYIEPSNFDDVKMTTGHVHFRTAIDAARATPPESV